MVNDSPRLPSRQEMFNRAWHGLKKQKFQRSTTEGNGKGYCTFISPNGCRCAWAHVDPGITDLHLGMSLGALRESGIGLALHLTPGGGDSSWVFAAMLMSCHDSAANPGDMEKRLRGFAATNGLLIPNDPPSMPEAA